MSNIEPTEEQKQAAFEFFAQDQPNAWHQDWIAGHVVHEPASNDEETRAMVDLARLLAEREAKAVARIKALANDEVAACGAHIESLESLLAKATDERDILRARVAELEATHADTRQELQMVLDDWNDMVRAIQTPAHGTAVARAKLLVQREAQHLADIKRLRRAVEDRVDIGSDEVEKLLDDTAHYDDAKAAEGGEG